MVITQEYKNAFAEVYTILDYIEDDDYYKIPEDVISVIYENRNKDYEYEMNEDLDIFKQPMLKETKAILFNFYRDYWSSNEQRKKIKKIQKAERQKVEEKKKIEYGIDNIFTSSTSNKKSCENNKHINDETIENNFLIEVKKEGLIIKIINKIKMLFKIHFK